MVYAFEIIGLIFLLGMIYQTYLEYKKKKISKLSLIFWMIVWVGGIFLTIFHYSINRILPALNLVRALDLYMILAFMFLFALVFYLFSKMKKVESRVETLTRILALKPLKEMKEKG
jgi:hypothetical protein